MTQPLSPGQQITQIAKGPVTSPGIATAIGGFYVYAQKGPINKPVLVTGPDQAAVTFGGFVTNPFLSRMSDSLIDFFAEGGASCYIARFIGVGYATASREFQTTGAATAGSITSSANSFPAALLNGATFLGEEDAGGPQTATVVANSATLTGAGGTFASVTANHTLTVAAAGVANQVVTFAGTENTNVLFMEAINTQVRGFRVGLSGGQLQFVADREGLSSSGQIVTGSADVLTSLGLTAAENFALTGGSNVSNVNAVTAAELAAIFNAAYITPGATATPNANNSLTVASNTTGAASKFQFTSGTGVALIAGFDNAAHNGSNSGAVNMFQAQASSGIDLSPGIWANSWSTQSTNNNVNATTVAATAAGSYPTLTFANTNRLQVGDTVSITKAAVAVRNVITLINGNIVTFASSWVVPGGGYAGTEIVVQETFNVNVIDNTGKTAFPAPFTNMRVSPLAKANYFVNVINGTASSPIFVTDSAPSLPPNADSRPNVDAVPVLFTGGLDGAAPISTDVTNNITATWNQVADVNEISIPGAATDFSGANGVAVLTGLQAYIANRGDVLAVVDEPKGTPPIGSGGARDWLQNTANLADKNIAVYWPWMKRADVTSGVLTTFPMSPHVQGCISRTHQQANIAQAPAGITYGKLQNAVDLEYRILEMGPEANDMYPASVNPVMVFPGEGICIYGCRTTDPTGEFFQVNIQIGFNIAKRLVRQKTRFVVFANSNPDTWAQIVRTLTASFREWKTAKILQGVSDAQAFFIICDETNNTPVVIASGTIKVRIGLAFQVAAEFVEETLELNTAAIDNALASLNANN